MDTTRLTGMRLFFYIMLMLLIVALVVSVVLMNIRPVVGILIILNILFIGRCIADYADAVLPVGKAKLYREREEDDRIIRFHNTKYYLGTAPLWVKADGKMVAKIPRSRNMDVPVPKRTKCVTIEMRGTQNSIDLKDITDNITINTWVKYTEEKTRRLEATVTCEGERFNDGLLMKIYMDHMKRRQSNAIQTLGMSTITLIMLTVIMIYLHL